jgi:1-acyl-sn-glycerol-3-phosphate acyltransferase
MTQIETRLAGRGPLDRIAYAAARTVLFVFLKLWCRLKVDGREHLPTSGPYILAPSHRSIIDTPVASGLSARRMRFMGADKWWSNKTFGRLLTALGGFPVTRGSADREALKRSIQVLAGGEPLVLFPEGERKTGPIVQPLYDGAVYVAMKAGVPIVPVGIGGTERVMPRGAKVIKPRRIHAVIGPPIPVPAETNGRVHRAKLREITEQLHDELQRLFDAAQVRAG